MERKKGKMNGDDMFDPMDEILKESPPGKRLLIWLIEKSHRATDLLFRELRKRYPPPPGHLYGLAGSGRVRLWLSSESYEDEDEQGG